MSTLHANAMGGGVTLTHARTQGFLFIFLSFLADFCHLAKQTTGKKNTPILKGISKSIHCTHTHACYRWV